MATIADGMTTVIPAQYVRTNASTTVPVRLSATRKKIRCATLIGNNAYQTANTGTVNVGWSSANGEQSVAIASGTVYVLKSEPGEALDLFDVWLDVANASDGLVVIPNLEVPSATSSSGGGGGGGDVTGSVPHDAAGSAVDPVLVGGYASAAAPTSVSADGDAVDAWYLRNGAQATVVTAAGALVGGDAANGLDVDVTRVGGNVTVIQGTATNLKVDASGVAVPVTDNSGSLTVDNGGTFATQPAGSVAHDAAATSVNPNLVGGYASAAAPSDVSADGDSVRAWHLRNGALATVLTAAGALVGGDATNGLDVDVTRVIPGTSATHLGKAADAAAGSTDTGIAIYAIRDDALSTLTPAEGDYAPLRVNSTGALHVTGAGGGTQYTEGDTDASITGTAVIWEDASDTLVAASDTKPLPVQQAHLTAATDAVAASGVAAHDAAASGNPVLAAGVASAAAPTSVSADGDVVNAWHLRNGAQATVVTAAGALVGGDAANGLDVDVTRVGGNVTVVNGGTFATQPAGSVAHDGAASAVNPNLVGGYASAAAPTSVSADGDAVNAWHLRNGAQATVITAAGALVGGDATNGLDVDVTRVTGTVTTSPIPGTSGGLTTVRDIDLDEASAANIKGSAGQVYGWYIVNTHATAWRYVKLYNKATGPTVGSDTPLITFGIPPAGGANEMSTHGIVFDTGIGWAATTGVADNDTGAPGANEVVATLFYK